MVDSLIVIFYLLSTIFFGIYYSQKIENLKEFLISKRNFSDTVMLATLFATVIGGGTTCGVVSNVYIYGIIYMIAFYGAVLNKLMVAHYIAPRIKNYIYIDSLGDLFENKYGKGGRLLIGVSTLLVSISTLGQQIMALGLIIEYFFSIPFLWGALLSFGALVIYSALGGIRAVVMTDVYQFIFILALIPLLCFSIIYKINITILLSSIYSEIDKFSFIGINQLITPITMFIVMAFTALDPSFIHRLILSKDKKQAIQITKITGYISFPLITFMGVFGIILSHLEVNVHPPHALPYMIDTFLPPLLKSIGIISLLSVVMSTADSNLHVATCSAVQDILLIFKKDISSKNQLFLARIMTFFISICAFFVCMTFNNIFDIMIFAFGFWGPTIIVPLIFVLYNYSFKKKDLLIGVFYSQILTISWNIFLKKKIGIDGLIPGMIFSTCFFLSRHKIKSHAYS